MRPKLVRRIHSIPVCMMIRHFSHLSLQKFDSLIGCAQFCRRKWLGYLRAMGQVLYHKQNGATNCEHYHLEGRQGDGWRYLRAISSWENTQTKVCFMVIKGWIKDRANHPYLQPVAELRKTQFNVVKSKGILKAPSAAVIRQLTTDHSLGLGVEHGRDQLQQLYSYEFHDTRLHPGGHPSSYSP